MIHNSEDLRNHHHSYAAGVPRAVPGVRGGRGAGRALDGEGEWIRQTEKCTTG